MSDQLQHEDRTILAALDALEKGDVVGSLAAEAAAARGEEGETLARLYTEVLGLLPLELDPAAPPPGLRQRILAAATGDETQELGAPAAPEDAAAVPPRPRGIVPLPSPAAAPAPERAGRERARRPSRWPLALAASLAFVLLAVSALLYSGLRQQSATISRLNRDLRTAEERADRLAAQQAQAQSQLAELRANFGLVTSPAVEISPMRPAGRSPQPQARGTLYVAADHQHWYLSVHGLQPLGEGRQYHLWFMADGRAVNGGSFDARPGSPVNLSSEHMPPGTNAVLITMEPGTGVPAPSGPEVLRAGAPIQVL